MIKKFLNSLVYLVLIFSFSSCHSIEDTNSISHEVITPVKKDVKNSIDIKTDLKSVEDQVPIVKEEIQQVKKVFLEENLKASVEKKEVLKVLSDETSTSEYKQSDEIKKTAVVLKKAILTAKEIIKQSDDLMRGDSLKGRYKMRVETPNWKRELTLAVWTHGRDKTFIRILSPAKEAGIGTLRTETNMWNYLPKVERTIKIPPSMMFQPWMGSDFSNDDLVKESSVVTDYTHKILKQSPVDGIEIYQIELLPKPESAVTWGKLMFFIRTEDLLPVREEFYDEDGTLVKVLNYSAIKQMSDRKIPTIWKMESKIKSRHRTVIEVLSAEYNKPHSETIYSLGNLKRVR